VKAKVGDRVQIEWLMRSEFPHGVLKGVGVHFFIVREGATGQKPVPDLKAGKWLESRGIMDFLPDHAARGSMQLTARTAGIYLVRLESEGTEPEAGHEHFSAIDLRVEEPPASQLTPRIRHGGPPTANLRSAVNPKSKIIWSQDH